MLYYKFYRRFIIFLLVLYSVNAIPALSQERGLHTFPRSVCTGFGGGVADWYARFDLVILGIYANLDFVYEVRALNPNTVILQTVDWNAGAHIGDGIPPEFRLTMVDGSTYSWYIGLNPRSSQISPNFSTACPVVNGKQCWEWFAEYIAQRIDFTVFDGLSTDGLYSGLHVKYHCPDDIDLDQNGVRDLDEHGLSWVVGKWNDGIRNLVRKVRELIGDDILFLVNSGVWFQGHPDITQVNGVVCEYWGYENAWDWNRGMYQGFIDNARTPHIAINGCNPKHSDPLRTNIVKDYYSFVRFTLTKDMLGGVYHCYQDAYTPWFYYVRFYDEYELDIGYATSGMLDAGNDVWIRFFDKGVSICNVSGGPVNITDSDLQSFSEYDGPYYRFTGGQDYEFNNGEDFTSVDLKGTQFSGYTVGDGIILVNEPMTAVTDIVLDNVDASTMPGSQAPVFNGGWEEVWEERNNYYLRVVRGWEVTSLSGYHTISGGSDATAVYTPGIGQPGIYEVYEWHGYHTGNESDDVLITINHANGSMPVHINQTEKQGQWNFLGNYYFVRGTTGNITVSATSSTGDVIADAFKLTYAVDQVLDEEPPNPVANVQGSNASSSSITLAWTQPAEASDGDIASHYEIYRGGVLVGSSQNNSFLDLHLEEATQYNYVVYAFDNANNKSTASSTVSLSTLADTEPPAITTVTSVNLTRLELIFSESIDEANAVNLDNYIIEPDITVTAARLEANGRTVTLETRPHVIGTEYSIRARNVKDLANTPNTVNSSLTKTYTGNGGNIIIRAACDDSYQLFVNGVEMGSGSSWNDSQEYTVASISGKNVIAIKGIDFSGLAGLVVEIEYDNNFYVSDDTWKVSTTAEEGWEAVEFNDLGWQRASALGMHGSAEPWKGYGNVANITIDQGVAWIWSSDNENDDEVYFRFTIRTSGDMEAPSPPSGLRKK
ncbi:hypothetical protein KAR48_08025 [bacterium]|nr:hypothetical protein [bacterium]